MNLQDTFKIILLENYYSFAMAAWSGGIVSTCHPRRLETWVPGFRVVAFLKRRNYIFSSDFTDSQISKIGNHF
jgi:hypothetical protein